MSMQDSSLEQRIDWNSLHLSGPPSFLSIQDWIHSLVKLQPQSFTRISLFSRKSGGWVLLRGQRSRGSRGINQLGGFCRSGDLWSFQEGYSSLWGLWQLKFLAKEDGILLWYGGGFMFLTRRFQEGGLYNVIPTETY